uniref:Uncharacterized protein n=1 Tax=Meloidogyne incognita TaxID=6306 RepID=A0A914ML48_MELIC
MPHRHGGGSSSAHLENIPHPLPNLPIVSQLPAIEGFERSVSEKLLKAANHNIDPVVNVQLTPHLSALLFLHFFL